MRNRIYLSLIALAIAASACNPQPPRGAAAGETYYAYCVSCHGADGSGSQLYEAPAIAGLDEWYVKAQLEKFRNGFRGAHHDDTAGLRMRPMALRALESDEAVALVSAYVASMPPVDNAPTLTGGDAKKGEQLYGTCLACHGNTGQGNQGLNAPALNRLDDWYMLSSLRKIKAGIRGANPKDATAATMRPMAMSLADEQAMLDVIAYISTLKP
jgi:cytochrome c553